MRGLYQSNITHARAALVGAGGGLVHTPNELEDELRTINTEIMQFGAEVTSALFLVPQEMVVKQLEWLAKMSDAEILKEWGIHVLAPGQPVPPAGRKPDGMWDKTFNTQSAETWKTRDQIAEKIEREGVGAAGMVARPTASSAALAWYRAAVLPFLGQWNKWYSDLLHTPLQLWPGGGQWDHAQESRQLLITLRQTASDLGIKLVTPEPLKPKFDPNVADGIGGAAKTIGSVAKYLVIGGLVIGGGVLLATLFHDVKSNKAPADRYERYWNAARRRQPGGAP